MKIKTLIAAAAATALFSGCMADKHPHWVYQGEMGPENWGKVSATCAEGTQQSPINIVSKSATAIADANILEFHESTTATISHEVDNGHAIKITPEDDHGISINGDHYKLLQFHFHGKSENTIDGKQFAMEAHLVHQNSKGSLAVVAIMIEEGAHNKALEAVIGHINGGDLNIATADILPEDTEHYYHFMGSLTTPPCSESVAWYVLKAPISIDTAQLAAFRSHHADNFRPVQPLNGRYLEAK